MLTILTSSHDTERPAVDTQNVDVPEKHLSASEPVYVNERRLMWKIDFHLVPPLCVLYLLAFLDRVNIANARLYNLEQDLELVGNQYNIALVMFFVPYVLLEIPANLLLKKFRPSIWREFPRFGGWLTVWGSTFDHVLFWFGDDVAGYCCQFCRTCCDEVFSWTLRSWSVPRMSQLQKKV